MSKPTPTRVLFRHTLARSAKRVFAVFLVLAVLTPVYSITRTDLPVVNAAAPSTLNFQARLMSANGSLVPDGNYNIEFKLYNAVSSTGSNQGACTGDANCLWTETRTGGSQVAIKNGYMSAYLGDVSALPSDIWDQQLWLSMNIGGTGSPAWDGEMNPRIRLTSVPYAFQAKVAESAFTLNKNTGSFTGTVDFATLTADRRYLFPDTSLATTVSPGTICVYNGAASNCPAASGSAYYIQNDTVLQTESNFNIQGRNDGTDGTIVGQFRGAAAGQTVDLLQFQASNGTVLGAVTAAGNLQVASSIDTRTAGTLSVGTANATAISIGDAGVTATVNGALTVNELFSANGGANILGVTNINTTGTATTTIGNSTSNIVLDGVVTVNEETTFNENVTVATGKAITLVGGATNTRPASPTEGMLYFDTDTKTLLVYANGKWQADGKEAIIVAASNSSQADRDAATYVTNGNTGAANDGDQVEINQALTAAAGKKVILLAGTYVVDASISVPNNTTLSGVGNGTVIESPVVDEQILLITNTDTTTGTSIVIESMKLDGRGDLNPPLLHAGVYLVNVGGHASAVKGVTVRDVLFDRFDGYALSLTNVSNTIIENNIATGSFNFVYSLDNVSNSSVTNNQFDSGGHSIYGTDVSDTVISQNTVSNSAYGIRLFDSYNNTISSNVISNSSVYGIFTNNGSNNVISDNVISYSALNGIYLLNSGYSLVSGNHITGSDQYGISLNNTGFSTLSDNKIVDSGSTTDNNAIFLTASDSTSVKNNSIIDSQHTVSNLAIVVSDSGSDDTYLAGNTLNGGQISDSGTNTVYGGQTNDTADFVIQPAGEINLNANTNVDGTLGVTGNVDFDGTLTIGSSDQFTIDATGNLVTSGTIQYGAAVGDTNTLVCRNAAGQLANCTTAQLTGNAFVQDGNAFGEAGVLGTTDNFGLDIITNNAVAVAIAASGNVTLNQSLAVTGTSTFNDDVAVSANNTTQTITSISGNSLTTGSALSVSSTSTSLLSGNLVAINQNSNYTQNESISNQLLNISRTINATGGAATITKGNQSTGNSTNSISGGVPALTIAHTIPNNSNRLLLLAISHQYNTLTVTYNGQALTKYGSSYATVDPDSPGNNGYLSFYYLINPPVGTANIVVTSGTNGSQYYGVIASDYYNVSQTTPIASATYSANNIDGYTNVSVSATQMGVDALATDAWGTYSANAGQTEISKFMSGPFGMGSSYRAGPISQMGWTHPQFQGQIWGHGVAVLNPASGAGTLTTTGSLATFSNNCLAICADSSSILTLNQQVASSTGTVLNILNSGTGLGLAVQGGSQFNGAATMVGANSSLVFSGVNTDITTLSNQDLTIDANGTGQLLLNDSVVVAAQQTLRFVGGTTAQRPASPTEGMLYFDTDTKTLLVYANGKWQADGKEAIIVAASNSSQADRDAATYVTNGNTGAANDGDQVEINQALTAAAGKKVILLAGTYTIDASISVPNNTTLSGIGNGTVVELADLDANVNMIVNTDTTTGTGITIERLKLNGRDDLNTAGTQHGIYLNGIGTVVINNGITVQQVSVINFRNSGIYLLNSKFLTVTNVVSSDNLNGIEMLNVGASTFQSNNMVTNSGEGFLLDSAYQSVIDGNTVSYNDVGIRLINGSNGNTITDNNVVGTYTYGISMSSNSHRNLVSGNSVYDNGGASVNNAIRISDSDNNIIVGNIVGDTSATSNNFAITIQNSTADANYLASNILGTGTVNDAGTGTIYGGQVSTSGNYIVQPAGTIELMKNTNVTGVLSASTSVLTPLVGRATAGTLSIGTDANSTAVTISRTGVTTTVAGALTVSEAGQFNGGLTVASNFTVTSAGNVAFQRNATDITATGTLTDLNTGTGALFRFNGASAQTLSSIANPTDGRIITLINAAATALTIQNETGGTATNQIITGTGGNISVPSGATITLAYDSSSQRWRVIGSTAATGGYVQLQGSTPGTGQTGNINVSGTVIAGTAVQTSLLDTPSGITTLNIGTTNATAGINLNQSTNILGNLTFSQGANRQISVSANTTANAAGYNLTLSAGAANGSTTGNTGGTLVLQGGAAAGTGNNNGGGVTITGGAATGTGAQGLVGLAPTAFTAVSSTQNFTGSGSLAVSLVNAWSTIPVSSNAAGYTVTIPAPTIATVGRVLYVSNVGSNDFNISLAGTSIIIALKPNTTATLIWNGNGWTAAGASSSTDLQSAYNNTLTSAGGAEIVLNPVGGAADGFTIRNNGTTPIAGGILEVQSSIGTNLFSVNNFGTELASNGGAENSTTFSTNWETIGGANAPTRTTASGQYVTGLAGVSVTTSAASNSGVRNNLTANPVVSTTYTVSFTAKLASGTFSTLQVAYTRDGGTNFQNCASYSTQTLSTSIWTKITCTITTDGTTPTNPDLVIRQTDATARTFYIDNLSFIRNDSTTQPSNVQIGGGINGGPITLFTLDRATAPPVANGDSTYLGSMYYDTTTGRIQCYESDGWGACGSAPDNIITLTPEYAGAVLNGSGVGTMTADFCGNGGGLTVNTTFCAAGEARNYYRWTSPQATLQTYSVIVTYKLPATFKTFSDSNTMKLTAYRSTNNDADALVTIETYRKNVLSGTLTQCGTTTNITQSSGTWEQRSVSGDENACGFTGGDYIIFKMNMSTRNNQNAYIENLDFTFMNQ